MKATSGAFCALLRDGRVVCWGDPSQGGDCRRALFNGAPVAQVAAARGAFCALLADGRVVPWGSQRGGGDGKHLAPHVRQAGARAGSSERRSLESRRAGTSLRQPVAFLNEMTFGFQSSSKWLRLLLAGAAGGGHGPGLRRAAVGWGRGGLGQRQVRRGRVPGARAALPKRSGGDGARQSRLEARVAGARRPPELQDAGEATEPARCCGRCVEGDVSLVFRRSALRRGLKISLRFAVIEVFGFGLPELVEPGFVASMDRQRDQHLVTSSHLIARIFCKPSSMHLFLEVYSPLSAERPTEWGMAICH